MTRKETDSMGTLDLPDDVYWGAQTARALENFPVSGVRHRPEFVRAYVRIKRAAAEANMELGVLDESRGRGIIAAADEVLTGRLADQFVVDVFQAGAGTSFNMNVNEVLANRALEILGAGKGDHGRLSPNDHVNMAQSTNDTFPTACHLAVLETSATLLANLGSLESAFRRKGEQFADIPKPGRTHLMDAIPVLLGAEFAAYGSAIARCRERIGQRREDLREIALGGTATGTGANTALGYREKAIEVLSRLTGEHLSAPRNSFEALQSMAPLAAFSGALRELAVELIRIANDLRLMNSGPTCGLGEIRLPAVQPGSSMMPGKVNPSMAECLDMVCFQVIGSDAVVSLAAQAGQLELNVMTPVAANNILQSLALLNNYLPVFEQRCVAGIGADRERCRELAERNPSMATMLAPKVGYLEAAGIVKESLGRKATIRDTAVAKGLLTKKEADSLLDLGKAARSRYD